jgi:hypothetical protein
LFDVFASFCTQFKISSANNNVSTGLGNSSAMLFPMPLHPHVITSAFPLGSDINNLFILYLNGATPLEQNAQFFANQLDLFQPGKIS